MSSLLLLVPIAILLVLVASAAYMWAVRNHQFEDLDRESERILFEEVANNKSKPDAGGADTDKSQIAERKSSETINSENRNPEGQA